MFLFEDEAKDSIALWVFLAFAAWGLYELVTWIF